MARALSPKLAENPNAVLLNILIEDYRNLVSECRGDGMSWSDIAKASGIPEYVVKCIAGEIGKNRLTPDRQSGR